MNKKKDWFGIIFGAIWFLASLITLALYLTGNLGTTFPVPRILALVYDVLGVVAGTVIQMVLSAFIFVSGIRGK